MSKEVLAQKWFTAAKRQDQGACGSRLKEHSLNLIGRHLAMIIVIEIAVHATLVAAIGHVEMKAERNAK